MSYAFETKHVKLPREYDRRVKLTEEDKETIRAMYLFERLPIREIARRYEHKVSRRTIQFVIFPERQARSNALYKERRKDGRYYNKAEHREAIKKTRKYKYKLQQQGIIKINS